MAFIGLGDVNKSLIAIIVGCIFCFLNRILNLFAETELFKNKILTNIFISFADTFTIIPFIIFKRKTIKKINENDAENAYENKLLKIYGIIHAKNDKSLHKWRYIILIGLIFFMNYFMFVYTFNITSNTWITYILFTSIFYYLIFKSKLFNHHYLSIVIILLAGLIIDLVQNNFVKDLKNNIIGFIFSFVRVILLSLVYAIMKYTMERKSYLLMK